MHASCDPHANEFLAAIRGLPEQTPSPEISLPAIGDFVSGMTAGKRWSGYVMAAEPHRLAVECSGAWIVVHPKDITH
jgi:hypothetical protein